MRKIKYFTFDDEQEFKNKCLDEYTTLCNTYGYYFGDVCSAINDIEVLLSKKKDFYTHRVAVYYTKEECYLAIYRKYDIIIEVLLECNGCQIAHWVERKLSEIKRIKKLIDEEKFNKMIKQELN